MARTALREAGYLYDLGSTRMLVSILTPGGCAVKDWLKRLRDTNLGYWAGGYVVVGGVLIGYLEPILDWFGAPPAIGRVVTVLLVAGFPTTLILAWFHGEGGDQQLQGKELGWLGLLLVLTIVSVFSVLDEPNPVRSAPAPERVTTRPRLGVLVEDRSSSSDLADLANAVLEHLILELGRSAAFDILSATDARSYVGRPISADSMGRAMDVDAVVMGSLGSGASGLVLNLEVVDPGSGLANESFSVGPVVHAEDLAAASSLAEEAAFLIRNGIGIEMFLESRTSAGVPSMAWESFWQAKRTFRDLFEVFHGGDRAAVENTLARAERLVERALTEAPGWQSAIGLRARIVFRQGWLAGLHGDHDLAVRRFREALDQLQFQPVAPESEASILALRGQVYLHAYLFDLTLAGVRGDALLEQAIQAVEAAAEAKPSDAEIRALFGEVLAIARRNPEARLELQRARELDPYLEGTSQTTVFRLYETAFVGLLDEQAREWCLLGDGLFPDDWLFSYCRLSLQAWTAQDVDVATADSLVASIVAGYSHELLDGFEPVLQLAQAAVLSHVGRDSEAMAIISGVQSRDALRWAPWAASALAHLGEEERALALLEAFAQERPDEWRDLFGARSLLRALAGEPRFEALIEQVN